MTENKIKGLLGTKLGMTQVFDSNNSVVPVTVVKVGRNTVTNVRTPERDGYNAIQLAFDPISDKKVIKPVAGQFEKANLTPFRHLAEIRTSDASDYSVGQELAADVFTSGDFVDVTGISKGKGFTGTMKRHGFAGLGASHGAHRIHRAPGSIGGCSTPGRVFRGLRMSGRHGGKTVTTQNLTIHSVDTDHGIVLIKGAIPGANGSLVTVKTAVKGGAKA